MRRLIRQWLGIELDPAVHDALVAIGEHAGELDDLRRDVADLERDLEAEASRIDDLERDLDKAGASS